MSGTENFAYHKWPDNIFPVVSFVFSHDGPFGLGGGWGKGGRGACSYGCRPF